MSSSEINSESHGSSKRTLAILLVVALVAGVIFPLASASETPGEPELNPDMNCLVPRIAPTEPEVSITQGVPGGSTFVNPESHVLTPGQYARDEVTPTRGGSPAPVPTPCYIPPNPTPQGVLWDNGPLVNEPGAGAGGADASSLQTVLGMNVYGFGAQNALGYHIADDFDVTDSWTINSITFYSYQTGSTTTSTIDGVYVQIWDGAPDGGGAVIWGDMVTNCLTTTGWSNIYRVLDTNLLATSRPIMEVVADTSGLTLTPGTYWVDVSLTGTLGSGPWMPPITINTQTTTGNAMQFTAAWAPMMDSGTATQQGIPFIIDGDVGGGGLDDILIYADDNFHTAPNTYVDQALNALGLPYTPYYDGDHAGFEADLIGGGPWDLVIYSGENYGPPDSVFDALDTYATGGGQLICSDWDIADRPGHPLWTTMGFTYQGEYGPPMPIYWWEPGHQVFNSPESVPEFTSVADPGYGTNGHRVEPMGGFDPIAGHTTPGPDPNEAALIWGNGGQTIYKSWLDGGNDADLDGDANPDGVELWIDMISSYAPAPGGVNNVAIFQTADPWGYPACQDVFDLHGISYDILGPADIGVVSLAPYQQVVIQGCDGQGGALYTAIAANTAWFENYAASGGYVNIQGADWGDFNDYPFGVIPGPYNLDDTVDINMPGHPIVMTPNVITDAELDGWGGSYHRYYTAWPPGASQVLTEGDTGSSWPVCLDFPWGAGHVRVTGQTTEWAWGHGYSPFLENLLIWGPGGGGPSMLDPADQTRFGWTGDYVDHYITIQNNGPVEDVYTVMFGPFQWPVTFYNLDYYGNKNEQTWWVGPAPPGGEVTFIAEHRVPRVNLGDFDTVEITVQSVNDPPTVGTALITTRTSLPTPYYNDFESGVFGQGVTAVDWTTDDPTGAGLNDMTSWPGGTHSMYTHGGPCAITSCLMHLEDIPMGIVSCGIQRGDDGFSEDPDADEDLVIEYADRGGRWYELGSFPGAGPPGEVFNPLYILPPNALQPKFQLRFRQVAGDEPTGDYWHIDNVYIGPPTSVLDLTPNAATGTALPGHIVDYDFTVANNALHADIYDLTINGNNWPTQILNSAGSAQINQIGPISPGDSDTFKVRVQVPPGTPFLDTDTVNVGAWSQLDPMTGDVSTATTTAAEPDPILTPDTATQIGVIGSLLQYPFNIQNGAPSPDSFTVEVSGNSWPTTAYLPHFTDDFGSGDISSWTVVDEGTSSGPSNWNAAGGNIRQTTNIHTPWASCGQDFPGSYVWNGDTGWNDYITQTRWQSTDNDGIGIMTRYTNQNNYYRFHWSADGAWDKDRTSPGTQYRVLDVNDNGVWSVLASDNVAYTGSQWYDIEMKNIGDRLQVYIDDTLIFDVTDNTHSNGAIALYNWGNSGSYFDDVVVYTPSPPTIGPIPSGGNVDFIVTVEIPPWAVPGSSDVADIIVSSVNGPAYVDISTVTTFAPEPDPILTPDIMEQMMFPCGFAEYTLNIRNGASFPDTFDIDAAGGWNAPTTAFSEDFEGAFPPAGWTVVDPDVLGGWVQAAVDGNANPPPDGTMGAYVRYEMGYNSDEWLITPPFSLAASTGSQLTYDWNWKSDWPTGWSEGYVLGSTDGGATWPHQIYTFPNDAAWSQGSHTWDISAWADGQPNVALGFHYVSIDDDWWWMIDNVEITYPTPTLTPTVWDATGTIPLTQIGPLAPGANLDFLVRQEVPPGSAGTQSVTLVTATSQTNPAYFDISTLTTYATPDSLWYDNFEDGDVTDWTEDNSGGGDGGVANYVPGQGCNSGVWSMFTRWDPVIMDSPVVPLNTYPDVGVGYWIQRGDDGWSEDPDQAGEDLIVEYLNNGASWIQLDQFVGNGPPGEIFEPIHQLPADALHPLFQLRFRQTGGSGNPNDYWHIDDVHLYDGLVVESSYVPSVIVNTLDDDIPVNPTGSGGGSTPADPVEPIIVEEVIEPVVEEIPEEPIVTVEIPEEVDEVPDDEVQTVDEPEPVVISDEDITEQSVEDEVAEPTLKRSTWTWTLFPVFFFIILVPSTYHYRKKRR